MAPHKDIWLSPELSEDGQRRFWDTQSETYEHADMTIDNEGELALVRNYCAGVELGSVVMSDVVTFGGAVGCRDPRVACEALQSRDVYPREIYFNDLSDAMVRHALRTHLLPYRASGTRVIALPGNVADITSSIPKRPRRVIVGVYHVDAFTRALPENGYPRDGLSEYIQNRNALGSHFLFQWCRVESGSCVPSGLTIRFDADEACNEAMLRELLDSIVRARSDTEEGALRVVAGDTDKSLPFISHWFNESGFRRLLEYGFGQRANSARIDRCAKGMVACIDPLGRQPEGIVTVLNNVLGNMLPEHLGTNLSAIHQLSE
jgi:hypothetical protein